MSAFKEHLGDKLSIYILLAVIGSLLFYYYFTYVPGNRNTLNRHASQILEDKAKTIQEKYKGYNDAVNSAPLSYLAKWYFKVNPGECSFDVTDERKEKFYFSRVPKGSPCNGKITRDSFTANARVDASLKPEISGPELPYSEKFSVWKVKGGSYYFVITPTADFFEVKSKEAVKQEVTVIKTLKPGATEQEKKIVMVAQPGKDTLRRYPFQWVNVTSFTDNLKDNDFFQDIFLVRANYNEKLTNDTTEERTGLNWHILDKSQLGLTRFHLPDTATRVGSGVYRQYIQGQWYHVHYKLVKLRRGLDVFVVALIQSDKLEAEAKSVASWFVVFCSVAALFLIFMFPVLKLFLLDTHERLSASDINLSIFSIILCGSLLVILIVGGYFFQGLEKEKMDENQKELSGKVHEIVNRDIEELVQALDDKDLFTKSSIRDLASFKTRHPLLIFNEVFALNVDSGRMTDIIVNSKNQPDVQKFQVRVSGRRYYTYFKDWSTLSSKQPFCLEAINSFATGTTEVAISKPYWEGDKQTIRVITSSLHALSQASVPDPFKFVVLNPEGDIKFHSQWSNLKSENFLRDCEDGGILKSYLDGNIKGPVDFTYLRKDSRGYFRHLKNDWYLLVYYEISTTRDLAAQVFMLCLLGLGAIILYSSVLHFILRMDRVKLALLKTTPFFYDWLNPKNSTSGKWKLLVIINAILVISQVLALFIASSITLLIFTALNITVSYLLNYYALRNYEITKGLRWLMIVAVFWLILFLVMLYFDSAWNLLLLIPILIAILLMVVVNYLDFVNTNTEDGSYTASRLSLYLWMFGLVIVPSFTFLVKHYNHELLLRNLYFLAEDQKWIDNPQNKRASPVEYHWATFSSDILPPLNRDGLDFLYYGKFPRHTMFSGRSSTTETGNIPEYEKYQLNYADTAVQLKKNETGKMRNREVERASLSAYDIAFLFSLLLIALFILLWWVLKKVARKIFYLPWHRIWELNPPSTPLTSSNEVQAENRITSATTHHNWQDEMQIISAMEEHENEYKQKWQSCSDEEKFFLYDLADDGVANQANKDVILSLFDKDLITLHPLLKVKRLSFAQFVRVNMKEEKILEFEKKASKSGRWNNTRIMLIIVVLAMFGFLSVAEEGFMGRAAALIGSLVLILPNLLTIVGSIGNLLARKTYAPPAS